MSVATAPHPTIPGVPPPDQPVAVRDAATVLLVRDEPAGASTELQIFMVRRRDESGFVGGHHVFPGGVIDQADRDEGWAQRCTGDSDAFLVGALRELLEESGVFLARTEEGDPLVIDEAELTALAQQVHAGEVGLLAACRERKLNLDTAALHPWSHWITPEGQPRRYDTRFFVAVAPEDQEAVHDGIELTEGVWASPAEFLRQLDEGSVQMILPTVATLRALREFPTTHALVAAARSKGPLKPVRPEMRREDEGSVTILIDGEPVWSEPSRRK